MYKKIFIVYWSIIFFTLPVFLFAEEITITTYYPSPYGSYSSLQADKLGVGDNNSDGFFTAVDVPTTTGDVWIKGNVGIGTTSPGAKLDVNGAAKISSWATQSLTTNGYAKVGSLLIQWGLDNRNSDAAFTITFPTAYSTACLGVFVNRKSAGATLPIDVYSYSTTGFTIDRNNDIDGAEDVNWMAIGY